MISKIPKNEFTLVELLHQTKYELNSFVENYHCLLQQVTKSFVLKLILVNNKNCYNIKVDLKNI